MSLTSGLFCSIDLAIVFMIVVLPAFGGDTMMPALALADRRHEVDDPRRHVARIGGILEVQVLVGEQRGEVLEARPPAGLLGVGAVDRQHVEQRRVLLVAPGRAARPGDVVALAQPELAGELDRDVGVLAAREVALDAQEAVALVAHVDVAGHLDGFVGRTTGCDSRSASTRPASSPCGPSAPRLPLRRRRRRRLRDSPSAGAAVCGWAGGAGPSDVGRHVGGRRRRHLHRPTVQRLRSRRCGLAGRAPTRRAARRPRRARTVGNDRLDRVAGDWLDVGSDLGRRDRPGRRQTSAIRRW